MRKPNPHVQFTHSNQRQRSRCKNCELRPLPEVCTAAYDVLDVEVPTGSDLAYINRLRYAYLCAGPMSGDTPAKGLRTVYATLAQRYPQTCPVLLLWRIRWQEQSSALACPSVRRPPPEEGSLSHRAMALRSCVLGRNHSSKCTVCRSLYAEIANAEQTLRNQDVASTRHRDGEA